MGTTSCLNCGKSVVQVDGRKEKKFCSDACRQKKWQKDQQAVRKHIKEVGLLDYHGIVPPGTAPKDTPAIPTPASYETYKEEILKTTWSGDLEKVMKLIDSDLIIGAANKAKLRAIANEHRTNFIN